jgi:hypothetical protein
MASLKDEIRAYLKRWGSDAATTYSGPMPAWGPGKIVRCLMDQT